MKKTILTFGLISGAISVLYIVCFGLMSDKIHFEYGEIIGYSSIVLAFVLIYFGIRSYRDNYGNGSITFGKAFQVGILICLISSICYVIAWMFVSKYLAPDFLDNYTAHYLEKLKASGASPEKIEEAAAEMASYKEMYKNPFLKAALTFLEPFPVGLIITIISSLILKKKPATLVAA